MHKNDTTYFLTERNTWNRMTQSIEDLEKYYTEVSIEEFTFALL